MSIARESGVYLRGCGMISNTKRFLSLSHLKTMDHSHSPDSMQDDSSSKNEAGISFFAVLFQTPKVNEYE